MKLYNTEKAVLLELERIGQRIGVREEGDRATCPDNKQPYVTIGWSHEGSPIKPERHPVIISPTPEAAWALWMVAFREYARERTGPISWRKFPVLHEIRDTVNPGDTWGEVELKGYAVAGRLHINEGDGKG